MICKFDFCSLPLSRIICLSSPNPDATQQNFPLRIAYNPIFTKLNLSAAGVKVLFIHLHHPAWLWVQWASQNVKCIPSRAKFLHKLSQRHFSKIVSDLSHPLFSRISFNNCNMSFRNNTIYKPGRCRTQKRAKSFFSFFMSEHNHWFFINLYIFFFLSQSTCKHSLLSLLW